jgi:hypothetical protein
MSIPTPTETTARPRIRAAALLLAAGVAAALLGACGSSPPPTAGHTVSASNGQSPAATNDPTTSSTTTTAKKSTKPKHESHTTTTTPGATIGGTGAPPPPLPGQVTFVGDSVGVDATPYVQQDIPGVHCDAKVDRSWGEGESILQSLAAQGQLGSVVVVELGLNGPISDADFQSMMAILAHVPRVVFLNIRLPVGAYGPGTDWWQDQNNSVLASEIPHYHNAVLANWYADSAGHPDWFTPDKIHLQPPGAAAMAALIKQYV